MQEIFILVKKTNVYFRRQSLTGTPHLHILFTVMYSLTVTLHLHISSTMTYSLSLTGTLHLHLLSSMAYNLTATLASMIVHNIVLYPHLSSKSLTGTLYCPPFVSLANIIVHAITHPIIQQSHWHPILLPTCQFNQYAGLISPPIILQSH